MPDYPLQMLFFLLSVPLGLIFGSFAGVLIHRLPKGQDILATRSHCHFCRHKLTPLELIPLMSWLFQKGRTQCCGRLLPVFYPLIELLMATGFVAIAYIFWQSPYLILPWWGVWFSTVTLAVIDIREFILPDLLLGAFGFFALSIQIISGNFTWSHILGGLIAALLFWCLWYFSHGKALGFGDVKLVLLFGLGLAWWQLIIGLYIAFLTGAIVGVILIIIKRKSLKSPVPFGPFLLFGFWGAAFFSEQIFIIFQRYLW